MTLDLEPWVLQRIDQIRRGFLWVGKKDARVGSCPVAWHSVCQPKALGGLGLHNPRWLSAALRVRWFWFQRTSSVKPWQGLEISVSSDAHARFVAAMQIGVGSGERILFWADSWIKGLNVETVAPDVLKLIRMVLCDLGLSRKGLLTTAGRATLSVL
jgi:hypothetical protein